MAKIYRNPQTGQLSKPIPEEAEHRIQVLEEAGWELVEPEAKQQKLPEPDKKTASKKGEAEDKKS
jgi:hypothetical protein